MCQRGCPTPQPVPVSASSAALCGVRLEPGWRSEYAGIEYTALPVNCSVFIIALCPNRFRDIEPVLHLDAGCNQLPCKRCRAIAIVVTPYVALIHQMNQPSAARGSNDGALPAAASPPAGDCDGQEGHQNHRILDKKPAAPVYPARSQPLLEPALGWSFGVAYSRNTICLDPVARTYTATPAAPGGGLHGLRTLHQGSTGSPGGAKDGEVQAAFRPWNCRTGRPGRRCTSTSVSGSAATRARASSKSIDKPLT